MNLEEGKSWVKQEIDKIKTPMQAKEFLKAYDLSCAKFFNTPAGIESERRDPIARAARHELARAVQEKFK